MNTVRVSLFVDGDYVSRSFAPRVQAIAENDRHLNFLRACGNDCQSSWKKDLDFLYTYVGAGKNAADILLIVQAME